MSKVTGVQSGGFPINFDPICLQWENISCLELSVAKWGFKTMLNFSLRHNLHVLVTGLKSGIFDSKIFWLTLGSPPKSFIKQNNNAIYSLNKIFPTTFFGHTYFGKFLMTTYCSDKRNGKLMSTILYTFIFFFFVCLLSIHLM